MILKKFEMLRIRDIDGIEVSLDSMIKLCKKESDRGLGIFVGSDSQKFFNKVNMVTSVCLHHPNKGALVFYAKQRLKPNAFPSLKSRMTAELFCSLDAAFLIKEMVGCDVEVHIDIGSDPKKCKTYPFRKEFLNIIKGQGFCGKAKPESWASGVADWFTKR